MGAHRLALEFASGTTGHHACHHCDNPSCCNPHHLYWGDEKSNAADMKKRGRNYDQRNAPGDEKMRTPPEISQKSAMHPAFTKGEADG